MSNTRTMLATLALGATIAFAGPAFADKMKATLSGAAEVPANTSAGKGTADIDYDPASKKLSWRPLRISMGPRKPARTPGLRSRSRMPPQARPKAAPR